MVQEKTRLYREYIADIQAAMASDSMPEVPYEVLRGARHVPLLATLLFNPYGPTIQTISTMLSDEHALPQVIIRRDLNPFAAQWQMPVGMIPSSTRDPFTATVDITARYLRDNGHGTRVTSRSFLESWPTAVMICPVFAHVSPILGTAFYDGARKAGLPLRAEETQARRFGAKLWDRATDDMNRALRHIAAGDEAPDDQEGRDDWPVFAQWWRLVTSAEMVDAAVTNTQLAWEGAVAHSPLEPRVAEDEAAGWTALFANAYRRGPHPGDALPDESSRVERVCGRWPESQIRPAETGWEITDPAEATHA